MYSKLSIKLQSCPFSSNSFRYASKQYCTAAGVAAQYFSRHIFSFIPPAYFEFTRVSLAQDLRVHHITNSKTLSFQWRLHDLPQLMHRL